MRKVTTKDLDPMIQLILLNEKNKHEQPCGSGSKEKLYKQEIEK